MSDLLTVAQAAATLQVPVRTIRRWCVQGRLPAHRVPGPRGPEWRVRAEDLDAATRLLDAATRPPDEPGGAASIDVERNMDAATRPFDAATGPDMAVAVVELEARLENRLARIEGVLAGQWMKELTARLEEMAASNEALHQMMAERDQAAATREAALAEALAQVHAEAQRREEAATTREAELKATLDRLETALAKPWWKRWGLKKR